MAKAKEYTFVVATPPSDALRERMARFLTETLAKYENIEVHGTVRKLAPEEAKRPAVDCLRMITERRAS